MRPPLWKEGLGEAGLLSQSPRLPAEVAGWRGHAVSFHVVPSRAVFLCRVPLS